MDSPDRARSSRPTGRCSPPSAPTLLGAHRARGLASGIGGKKLLEGVVPTWMTIVTEPMLVF